MKKVLFISYYFPPVGFAGVQRTVKFAKYLPDNGYDVAVVAGSGSKSELPEDLTMMNEAKKANVYQVELNKRERQLSNISALRIAKFLPLRSMDWWVSAATRKCEEAVIREKPDLLYVTVSPFSAARVGAYIRRKYKIPWVLDMRDPWALDPWYFYPTRLHHFLHMTEMEKMCSRADAVVMNTPNALYALGKTFPRLDKGKLYYVTNGWDPEDFCGVRGLSDKNSRALIIAHTGSFSTEFAAKVNPVNRKMLGRGRKNLLDWFRHSAVSSDLLARSPFYLFQAIRNMIDEKCIEPEDIKLIFAGIEKDGDRRLITEYGMENTVEYRGYLNHSESIRVLIEADVLFLPLHKPEGGAFPLIVPGKTYEYMAAQKPILALLPKGDAADFMEKSRLGYVCDPTDIDQIARALFTLVKLKRNKDLKSTPDMNFINAFDRRRLSGKLAGVFEDVLRRSGCQRCM